MSQSRLKTRSELSFAGFPQMSSDTIAIWIRFARSEMSDSTSDDKDSVTEVAEESFVRERPPDIERGTVLAGRYQIEDIIGKGGSGIVLRVFDRTAQNVVALKVLKSELARDAKWEKRFSRELRLGRPIQHPNVCRIFDIGEADGHRFLTMEIARGGSLRDELKSRGAPERPLARSPVRRPGSHRGPGRYSRGRGGAPRLQARQFVAHGRRTIGDL